MVDITTLPFCEHVGFEQIAIGNDTAIALEPGPHHLNHLRTIHAGVVFSLGESAAAKALIDRFPEFVDSAIVVLRTASVKYHRPGTGRIHGVASIDEPSAARMEKQLARKGVGGVDVSVKVMEAESELLSGSYSWFVRHKQEDEA